MDRELGEQAVRHLQALIRIDTTNPPGNETPAAEYLADILSADGVEPQLLGPDPRRKSVVARVRGDGSQKPLLLAAHTDVVPVELSRWTHPPFAGEIHDGYLWGRGAIDMKHMAVMSALVVARLKREGVKLARDVIFAGVADEEMGCEMGSKWLVDHYPELVRAEYAIGESGAFTVYLNGATLYPIATAERGLVWMKLKLEGPPGHGSLPRGDNVLGRVGRAVHRLVETRLPQHRTAVVDRYLDAVSKTQKFPANVLMKNLHVRKIADVVLSTLKDPGIRAATQAMLSNSAVPTVIRAGTKTNVIPAFAEVELDGRTLPTQTAADLIAEVKKVVEEDCEIEILRELPPVEADPTSPVLDVLMRAIREHHPGATPVPYLMPGFTDAKNWSRLGTQCYGFMPVRFPDDGTRFGDLFHGHDERIPVEGLVWGAQVLYDVVKELAARGP
ncbi:M20/M25/M40 family metallo-hydrolase [Myxococcota bacterium]|nr:M20/M25/M40 family metallo-hydrolase [Myxococcota bacterium]